MMDWKTVRFDPAYEEKLDPEIIPLCDVLNYAGFVTISSCCGHGYMWPHVWFEHSTDERIERLARFVLAEEKRLTEATKDAEGVCHFPYFSMWQKEVRLDGYLWSVELHLNNVFHNTQHSEGLTEAVAALNSLTTMVRDSSI